jgi:hypothetical protein
MTQSVTPRLEINLAKIAYNANKLLKVTKYSFNKMEE